MAVRKLARHSWDVPLSWIDASYEKASKQGLEKVNGGADPVQQRTFAGGVIASPMMFFAKLSLLLLFLRLFSPKKGIRWALYAAMIFAFCIYFVTIPLFSYFCTPAPAKPWDLSTGAKCGKTIASAPTLGTLNVVLDVFILVTPIATIARLQMSRKKKLGVLAVFTTGFLYESRPCRNRLQLTLSSAVIASVVGMTYRIIWWRNSLNDPSYYRFTTSMCM